MFKRFLLNVVIVFNIIYNNIEIIRLLMEWYLLKEKMVIVKLYLVFIIWI